MNGIGKACLALTWVVAARSSFPSQSSQGSDSSCHDGLTFLQHGKVSRALEAWEAPQALAAFRAEVDNAAKKQGPTCLLSDLDLGLCVGPDTCFACNFTVANQDLPTIGTRFPDSKLLCDGDTGTTCSQLFDSLPIVYKESSQVLVCKGSRTCDAPWRVENVGAVCCSSSTDVGQTCDGARFQVQAAEPLCQNDVCCDGNLVCANSNIELAESVACKGFFACSSATIVLERDLYCNETSNANPAPGDSGHTCSNSQFVFTPTEDDPKHLVDCLGNDVCSFSTFDFSSSDNASISMLCDSNASGTDTGIGSNEAACLSTEVILGTDDCLDLFCVQNIDCEGMTVDTSATGSECFFVGDETFPNIPANCRVVNETQCGPIPPDDICCLDDPDCGSCCNAPSSTTALEPNSTTTSTTEESSSSTTSITSTTSTTSASTTSTTSSSASSSTTTKKKKPYSQYRRHRRYDRIRRYNHRPTRRIRKSYRYYS